MTNTMRLGNRPSLSVAVAVLTCWTILLPAQQMDLQLQKQIEAAQKQIEVVARADKETTNAELYLQVRRIWQEQNKAELLREMNDAKVKAESPAECFPKDAGQKDAAAVPESYPLRIAAQLAYTKMAVAQGRPGDLVESARSASPVTASGILLATALSTNAAAVVTAVEPLTSHPCSQLRLAAIAVLRHLAKRDGVAIPTVPALSPEDQSTLDDYGSQIVRLEIMASPDPRAAAARVKAMRAGTKPTTASGMMPGVKFNSR
jgi:hypothetical protein